MGLFKKKSTPVPPETSTAPRTTAPGDDRYPGIAGYQGVAGLKKNAMPERRFRFVRPDGKPD